MSHDEKKRGSAEAGLPTLTGDAKATSDDKSSVVEQVGGGDSQDEVNAFTRRDVHWTDDEERALLWRLGASHRVLRSARSLTAA
jgi:hypothetical protein